MVLQGMKPRYTEDPNHPGEKRLPGFGWFPNRFRHLLISSIGEFVGTFLFLFFAFAATQVANNLLGKKPMDLQALTYISLAFGVSLAVNVWVFFRISGGLFNPAVTVALALAGSINWLKAGVLIITQIIAGIAAAGVVYGLFAGPLAVRTSLEKNTSVIRGLFIEMFLTFQLIFTIFMLAVEKHRSTFLAPVGIGMSLYIAEMAGVFFTGASLNPARSFGPDLVLRTFDSYHWIYWIGPLLGAILSVIVYRLFKTLEYETANPGADGDGQEVRSNQTRATTVASEDGHDISHRRTDGTDETNFATYFQPNMKKAPPAHQTISMDAARREKLTKPIPAPMPAFQHGGDGHHQSSNANTSINHPDDRPRAHHTRILGYDHSYRSGPSTESGTSSA
ncbi:aquaporin-like protein [Phaeosphaeriaceae sp. PMI808]|nr:aquaporin-like protein [Phaeosphaeriaceae sp. PMI808]